ncbi:MAG: hypothetical protein P3A28_05090 [Gemmatimonadota bacterium]|nr:hypothetical protein [Gemmatimonadota bacterium]
MESENRLLLRRRLAHWPVIAAVLAFIACSEHDTAYAGPRLRLATAGKVVGAFATAVRGNQVAIAWFETAGFDTAVFVSRSIDGGSSFSAELRVSPPGERTMHRSDEAPQVELILDPDGFAQPFLAWSRAAGGSSEIVWSYTVDGTTYSKPATIPGSAGRGTRTLITLARDSADRVFATWEVSGASEASRAAAMWQASTDGMFPARRLHAKAASPALAEPPERSSRGARLADGSWVGVWTDSSRAPGTLRLHRSGVGTSKGSERASPDVALGNGTGPIVAFPGTGPILIWISHRDTGREINVIPLR